jgi:hypothetical protein
MNQARRLPEGNYIPLARRVLVAQQLKAKAAEDELSAKRSCASAMHSVDMTEFEFSVEGSRYKASLERKYKREVNVRKLYTLLANNELTIDEFLSCIEAPLSKVNEVLAPDTVSYLCDSVKGGLDLYITEV